MTKYASGEEPQVGDLVRRDSPTIPQIEHGCVDVVEFCLGGYLHLERHSAEGTFNARFFTLIARAGQPMEYLPGDVVEAVVDFTNGTKKRLTKGNRYTVAEGLHPGFWIDRCDAGHQCCWGNSPDDYFRLVQRPDAPKVEEGLAQRSPQKPIAEIARDLRPGQKVRVETKFEGEASGYNGESWQVPGVWLHDKGFTPLDRITSLEIIEDAPPKPLAVGDRVKNGEDSAYILFIDRNEAVLRGGSRLLGGDHLFIAPLDKLERA